MTQAFAVWLTGLPASGKSTIARHLSRRLEETGLVVEVLESDAVRRWLTPNPTYDAHERELFYRALAYFGSRLVWHGVPVLFDATANRRSYRELAHNLIPHFLEVSVVCPLEVCMQRDQKGTYQKGTEGQSFMVPGLHDPYEPPEKPELAFDTTVYSPEAAADGIMKALEGRHFLSAARSLRS